MAVEWMPEMEPIGEGSVALEAVAVVKVLDEEGQPGWYLRTTRGLSNMEALGMLQAGCDTVRDTVRSRWDDDEGSGA